MRVLVLNGSPKGKYSITLHTSLYLEKKFPQHNFQFLNVGQRIKSYEKDFTPVADAITAADLLIFPIRFIPLSHQASCIGLLNC